MKKVLSIMIFIIMFSVSLISCDKGKNSSKDSSGNVIDYKTDISKEDESLARIKVVDSILKVMKDESPYPEDMKVLSIKDLDSVTYSEIANKIFSYPPVEPQIIPELKKRALDKSILGYVMTYKIRYRVNDMNVVVHDFIIVLSTSNETIHSADYKQDHSSIVHYVAQSFRNHLINTTKI